MARPDNGVSLRLWLEMLGWQIRSTSVDRVLVGVATHTDGDGKELYVVGRGQSESELGLQLFEAAMNAMQKNGLDTLEHPLDRQLAAA